ncbi:MAG: alkaline phosphatase family protein [Phycisphaerales bacterium]
MKRTLLLDLPALSARLLDALPADRRPAWLNTLIARGRAVLQPPLPAVTMTVQATIATGVGPDQHGMIANGLPTFRLPDTHALLDTDSFAEYRRNVSFWEQSADLVQGPRFWQQSPPPPGGGVKVALICVQSCIRAADVVVTPKPAHTPDGRTVPDCWTHPARLNDELKAKIGPLPLMHYWGPLANIKSSQWIAAAAEYVWRHHPVDLQWVYVPHLDYDAQRLGPGDPRLVDELFAVLNVITPLVELAERDGARVVLFSEYGMTNVTRSFAPNAMLRHAGLLTTKPRQSDSAASGSLEIDFATTPAFALCDHQVAHIYCRDTPTIERARSLFQQLPGVKITTSGGHPRAGELVLYAPEDAWFEYRWWDDWAQAPDYAWSVDIHRKPGYDPTELFFDPAARRIRADQPRLVKGSHGALPADQRDWPVLLGVENATPVVSAASLATLL